MAVCLIATLTVACQLPNNEESPQSEETVTAQATQSPSEAQDNCITGWDGCYSRSNIVDYYSKILNWTNEFFATNHKEAELPANYYWITTGRSDKIGFCEGNFDDKSFFYCPGNHSIYVGLESFWEVYSEDDDTSAAVRVAHEVGHHAQYMARIYAVPGVTRVTTENQADCFSGAFSAWATSMGYFQGVDDQPAIEQSILKIGDKKEGDDRTHGTSEERLEWYKYGFEFGLSGCSRAVPERSLIDY